MLSLTGLLFFFPDCVRYAKRIYLTVRLIADKRARVAKLICSSFLLIYEGYEKELNFLSYEHF
jgi:hypothetical protein